MKRTKSKARAKPQVRIIAGRWKGRKLPVLDIEGLRPTTDRVRETLFNWLMHDVRGAICLDLFAGSGALGFECLSRGADYVQFVELEVKAANLLQDNLSRLIDENKEQAETGAVFFGSAEQFLTRRPAQGYDLVFLDPPFVSDLLSQTAQMLESQGWLCDNTLIYLEHHASDEVPRLPNNWHAIKQARAGQCAYSLWQRLASE